MNIYDDYFDYKKEKIQNLDTLNITELKNRLEELFKSADEDFKKYIKWDIELLVLCDSFLLFTKKDNTCLVDFLEFQDGKKYPDFRNFDSERIEYYKANLNIKYSDEVLSRIYNFLIDVSKEGYLYVTKAIEVMNKMVIKPDDISRKFLGRIIILSIKYNHKGSLYENIIKKLREFINYEISNDSPYAAYYFGLYSIAIFIKQEVYDSKENVIEIIQKVLDSVNDYFGVNPFGSEELIKTALEIAENIKDCDLIDTIKHKNIEYNLYWADKYYSEHDYYRAEIFYEKAAHISNEYGFLSRVNYIMDQIKKCCAYIGNNTEALSSTFVCDDKMEEIINSLITGNPENDFYMVSKIIISNIICKDSFFPSFADSGAIANERYHKNWFWQFVSISKMSEDRKIVEASTEEQKIKLFLYEDYVSHIKIWSSLWMEAVFGKLIDEKLTADQVVDQLTGSAWLSDTNKYLIREAIVLLFEERYAGFMHIAIPTYESIFRRLFGFHDISTTKLMSKDNSQQEKIFGEFLNLEIVKENVPKKLIELTRVIFVDQLGLNLRNNIAHGLCEIKDFDRNGAYIILTMLILITRFDWIEYQQQILNKNNSISQNKDC